MLFLNFSQRVCHFVTFWIIILQKKLPWFNISFASFFLTFCTFFFVTKRDPVRLCNFHTVDIWGFLLTEGPFQLKWWLWLLYCSFLVALVFVPPKNGGFGYGAPHLPEKNLLKTEKNQGKQKHTQKKTRRRISRKPKVTC